MDERRQFPRAPLRVQAEIAFPSWATLKFFYSMNISKGGMLLVLKDQVPVGAALNLKLRVEGDEAVQVEAVVRHVAGSPVVVDRVVRPGDLHAVS